MNYKYIYNPKLEKYFLTNSIDGINLLYEFSKQLGGYNIGHYTNIFRGKAYKSYKVHQLLTEEAWGKAIAGLSDEEQLIEWYNNKKCMKLEYLKHGVMWNDLPRDESRIKIDSDQCERLRPAKLISLGKVAVRGQLSKISNLFKKKGSKLKPTSKMWQTHFGDTQFYHSMKNDEPSELGVVYKIKNQLIEWYKKSIYKIGIECTSLKNPGRINFLGRILHTIQDSYSESHTHRDANYNIVEFFSYKIHKKSSDAEKKAKKRHSELDSLSYLNKKPRLKERIIECCKEVCANWLKDIYNIDNYIKKFNITDDKDNILKIQKIVEDLSKFRIREILSKNYTLVNNISCGSGKNVADKLTIELESPPSKEYITTFLIENPCSSDEQRTVKLNPSFLIDTSFLIELKCIKCPGSITIEKPVLYNLLVMCTNCFTTEVNSVVL